MAHKHYWDWQHTIICGRKESESAIVRMCSACGLKQVAFVPAKSWRKATGDYALNEHYK